MKRLFVVFLLGMVGVSALFAQSLTLQGTVNKSAKLTITDTGAGTLDLSQDITAPAAIATVNEKSNSAYIVSVVSANGVMLVGPVSGETLSYELTYDGTAVTFTGSTATLTPAGAKTGGSGINKTLGITYGAGTANLSPDTYSDTLTFTITTP